MIVDGNDSEVLLYENTTASTPLATDTPELLLASYAAPAAESGASDAGYAGHLNAGTDLCEAGFDADYFVDWAVPWEDLASDEPEAEPTEPDDPGDSGGVPGDGGSIEDLIDGLGGKVLGGCGSCSTSGAPKGLSILVWLGLPLLALRRRG